MSPLEIAVDPWRLEIIAVRAGSHSATERSALRRDEQRGLLLRLGLGAYVERTAFERLDLEQQHVVRMRALVATSDGPVTFSHWSAAVLNGLPVMRKRLGALHVTVPDAGSRSGSGLTGHVFALQDHEVVEFDGLRATGVGRTVVDVAGASPFEEGVMAADGALRAGVPRMLLLAAVESAGPRRAGRRILEVVSFAHPGAESPAESRFRISAMRLGVEVPILQFRIVLADRSEAFVDGYLAEADVGIEVDGDRKYLDPTMATQGTGRALLAEKRREDEVRTRMRGLARIGWVQSGSTAALRTVFARLGVRLSHPRGALADYIAAAAGARPRSRLRDPRWRA